MDATLIDALVKLGATGSAVYVAIWFSKHFFEMQRHREVSINEERVAREKQQAEDAAARSALENRKMEVLEQMARGIANLQDRVVENTAQTHKLRKEIEQYVASFSGDLPRATP